MSSFEAQKRILQDFQNSQNSVQDSRVHAEVVKEIRKLQISLQVRDGEILKLRKQQVKDQATIQQMKKQKEDMDILDDQKSNSIHTLIEEKCVLMTMHTKKLEEVKEMEFGLISRDREIRELKGRLKGKDDFKEMKKAVDMWHKSVDEERKKFMKQIEVLTNQRDTWKIALRKAAIITPSVRKEVDNIVIDDDVPKVLNSPLGNILMNSKNPARNCSEVTAPKPTAQIPSYHKSSENIDVKPLKLSDPKTSEMKAPGTQFLKSTDRKSDIAHRVPPNPVVRNQMTSNKNSTSSYRASSKTNLPIDPNLIKKEVMDVDTLDSDKPRGEAKMSTVLKDSTFTNSEEKVLTSRGSLISRIKVEETTQPRSFWKVKLEEPSDTDSATAKSSSGTKRPHSPNNAQESQDVKKAKMSSRYSEKFCSAEKIFKDLARLPVKPNTAPLETKDFPKLVDLPRQPASLHDIGPKPLMPKSEDFPKLVNSPTPAASVHAMTPQNPTPLMPKSEDFPKLVNPPTPPTNLNYVTAQNPKPTQSEVRPGFSCNPNTSTPHGPMLRTRPMRTPKELKESQLDLVAPEQLGPKQDQMTQSQIEKPKKRGRKKKFEILDPAVESNVLSLLKNAAQEIESTIDN